MSGVGGVWGEEEIRDKSCFGGNYRGPEASASALALAAVAQKERRGGIRAVEVSRRRRWQRRRRQTG